jgi:hypothetical protein
VHYIAYSQNAPLAADATEKNKQSFQHYPLHRAPRIHLLEEELIAPLYSCT